MNKPAKMLLMLIDETDRHDDFPLYEFIVRRLVQLELAGATVQAGIMGFGRHQRVHRKRLFGVADDRPISIFVVDEEAKILRALPQIRPLIKEGLVLLMDVEVVPESA